ncbi:MAG: hypothetical protein ABJZ55_02310 [Fuerstiella sp.]
MLTDTIQNLFQNRNQRRTQQGPAFAAELFEERLQLSAVVVAATIESFEATEHSYPEDSDGQYPEDTVGAAVPTNQINLPDSPTVIAFPTTPASPSLEPTDNTAAQPLLLSAPTEVPPFSQPQNADQASPSLIDAEFASNTIPLLLGEQLFESELNTPNTSPEAESSATTQLQDISDFETISSSETDTEPADEAVQPIELQPVTANEDIEAQPANERVPVAVQPLEQSTVSEATEVGLDEFFANEPQLYAGNRAGAVMVGLSLANKGFSNRKQRRRV